MFMLHGRLAVQPGKPDELLAVLSEGEGEGEGDGAAPLPGCRLYLVAVDQTDPDGVWVTEVWESEEAHLASLQLDRAREEIARAMPLLDPEGFRRQQLDARAGIPS